MKAPGTFRPGSLSGLGAWLAALAIGVLCYWSGARAADSPGGNSVEAVGRAAAMDAKAKATTEYEAAIRKGDARFAAGDYFEAVRAYEQAGRIAYNNKLSTDSAALADRLARARTAHDDRRSASSSGPAPSAATVTAADPGAKPPLEQYDEAMRRGDSFAAVGNFMDAVLSYEHAGRIAYNGKLATDAATLADKLAKARKARDDGEEGRVARYLELTVPQGAPVRTMRPSELCHASVCFVGEGNKRHWLVTNPYLPSDRHFLSMIYRVACSSDGTVYVAGNGVVSATETRRPPRANLEWYADNGHGLWRVAPDGRVTAFSVGPYGTYPPGHWKKWRAHCDVSVAEAASFRPDAWGGAVVGPTGDAYVSHTELHMILKLRGDGYVEHVAGGGEQACTYERLKDTKKEAGLRDGPRKRALFSHPTGLALDREGNLFVADPGNCALRRISPSGEVSTVHKGFTPGRNGCYAAPSEVEDRTKRINHQHVAVDPEGRPVVGGSFVVPSVDIYSNVHRFHADGRVEQLLAARIGYANTGQLRVGYLTGLSYLPDGRLLIADGDNGLLRIIDGPRLTDWLGAAPGAGKDTGRVPQRASVGEPGLMCVAGDSTLFVAPYLPRGGPVLKVDIKTRAVSAWAY